VRKYGKKDDNQAEIVKALRMCGCTVFDTSAVGNGFPDLAVGIHDKTILLEIKRPKAKGQKAGKKTKAQEDFFATWRGQVHEVQTVDEALQACGVSVS
jgi:type VI protein secretion system component VasF